MSDKQKPKVQLVGQDGNVFNLLGICTNALRRAGQSEEAKELQNRVMSSGSYYDAIAIMYEYVDDAGSSAGEDDDNNSDDDYEEDDDE